MLPSLSTLALARMQGSGLLDGGPHGRKNLPVDVSGRSAASAAVSALLQQLSAQLWECSILSRGASLQSGSLGPRPGQAVVWQQWSAKGIGGPAALDPFAAAVQAGSRAFCWPAGAALSPAALVVVPPASLAAARSAVGAVPRPIGPPGRGGVYMGVAVIGRAIPGVVGEEMPGAANVGGATREAAGAPLPSVEGVRVLRGHTGEAAGVEVGGLTVQVRLNTQRRLLDCKAMQCLLEMAEAAIAGNVLVDAIGSLGLQVE